ncbi:uncharacterized protein SPPG_04957 [Spizellomyces punctatus DAOM BR117]|uniref:Uncharacterized protein n=1 Tax=Spizellomyces punctatus (strain DAOM BR117) TaxID=645134 RepID=A0A0L0HFM4_SPIPD|nr:uncharacterized protein SPPG_04957 [Spizellomyces punctatus DAOM BR117]KNC99568.1 hypothetical protein SPPG_04957 [Spizellomyces punctatus DAOM BR117]|eukprot:XP_016607608.1 hypothetical protein SPPG_04957 [Spizellomyces punctatus DAOM BR117]
MASTATRQSWTHRDVPVPHNLVIGGVQSSLKIPTNERPTDAWRKSLILLAKRRHDRIVETANASVTDSAKWATCIASVEGTPFVAIGSAARANNLFILENTASSKFSSNGNHNDMESQSPFQLRSAFTAPNPIYSMSISGSNLLTGGPNGRAQLFELNQSELGQKGRGLTHLSEIVLESTKLEDMRLAPPGTMICTLRLHCVEFAPTPPRSDESRVEPTDRFLATVGRRLFVYDLKTNQVHASVNAGEDAVQVASWSPHFPLSLICTGGIDRAVGVWDARLIGKNTDEALVWKVSRAHEGAVTDVRFNPFIPYWMASAGEDAVVKLWDLRYVKHPVGRIDGHCQSIQSLAWSNTHCEILTTASSDRSWRAWSFAPDVSTARETYDDIFIGCPGSEWGNLANADAQPHVVAGARLIGEWGSGYTAPVIKVVPSKSHIDTFYALSAVGEVKSHTILGEVFEPVIPHRFDPIHDGAAHDVERSIYVRDMSTAYSDVVSLCRAARREGRLLAPKEQELLDLCTPRSAIEPTTWNIPPPSSEEFRTAGEDAVERLRRELEMWTYFLPPGFGEVMAVSGMLKQKLRLEYEMALLRCNIISDVLKGGWETLVKAEKMICKGMEMDPYYVNGKTLQLFVRSILPHDLVKGLTLGLKLAEIVEDTPSRSFADTAETIGIMLFPTTYDDARWLPAADTADSDHPLAFSRTKILAEYVEKLLLEDIKDLESGQGPDQEANSASTSAVGLEGANKGKVSTMDRSVKVTGDRRRLLAGISGKALPGERKCLSLRALAEDPGLVLPMVRMEIRFAKAIFNRTIVPYDEVIKIFESPDAEAQDSDASGTGDKRPASERTISAYANQVYLDALLEHERWVDYFAVCFDLIALYVAHDFSRLLVTHADTMALPQLKSYIDERYQVATAKLAQALQLPSTSADAAREILTSGMGVLKEALVLLVKVGASFFKLGNVEREGVDKMRGTVLKIFSQLSGSLFRTLDVIERMLGAGGLREAAQNAQSAIKDAAQALGPTARKTPGSGAVPPAGAVASPAGEITLEVTSLIEQLGKVGRTEVGANIGSGV